MIVLNDVCRRFSEAVLAVGNVSLTIAEGEFVTLLGASGCGKTTLLRMLAGFDHPTSGTIHLAGEDVTDLPPYSRDLNMVFQDYALFPHLTVARNVAFGLQRMGLPKGEIATKVDDALRLVALNDKAERMPHELSGGQRQRVALARALVRGPRVLLLDEPLSALDAGLREAMQVELKRLHELLGITFVMVTHDQTEALAMSDRIVVMHEGRIAQVGSPDELYNTPKSTYVASFIGTTNMFEARALRSTTEDLVVETRFGSYRCRPRPEVQQGDAVFLGVRPEYLRIVEPGQAAAGNVFPCVVRDMLFHGTYTRFRCTLGATEEQAYWDWIPRVHSDLENRPRVGSEKALTASPEELFVFTREETQ